MIYLFGRKQCTGCQKAKKTLEEDGKEFKFIDLDEEMDADTLALAAYYGVLKNNKLLPITVEE